MSLDTSEESDHAWIRRIGASADGSIDASKETHGEL